MKLNFFDKNDPRIFLYKLPKHKWMGVTLNFAHVRAWKILFATLLPIPLIVGIIFALSLLLKPMNNTFDWRAWSMVGSSFVLIISYIVVISIYYFRMAAKDALLVKDGDDE